MKLRTKTLLIIGATLLVLLGLLYGVSRVVLMAGFAKVEHEDVVRNVKRVLDAFSETTSNLSIKAADWSKWDDTYAFVKDSNTAYIESNLSDESLLELKLNVILIMDKNEKVMFGRSYDLEQEIGSDIDTQLLGAITSDSSLVQHQSTSSVIAGIKMFQTGPMAIVSRPVLTSQGNGPINGTIMFGRYLDDAEIDRIARITHLSVTTVPLHQQSQMSPDMVRAVQETHDPSQLSIRPASKDTIFGYANLFDMRAIPVMLVRIGVTRDIHKQGTLTMVYLVIAIVVVGICFGITILLLIEKVVLSRVSRLSLEVENIGKCGDHSARVKIPGADELGALGNSVNTMLAALEKTELEIRNRNREMRLVMDSVPSALLSIDQEFHINPEYSQSAELILGLAELSGMNFLDVLGLSESSSSSRKVLREYLELFFQGMLPDKEMAGLNPFEEFLLQRTDLPNPQWLRIRYFIINRGENESKHILVVIEDITEEKKLQEKVEQSEKENLQLKAIAEDPDLFKDFLAETRGILRHAEGTLVAIDKGDIRGVVNEVFRDVHTIKGTAGAFGLSTVSEIAGQMEESLNPLRESDTISEDMIEKTKRSLALLSQSVMDVVENAKKILGEEVADGADICLRVSLDKLKKESAMLKNMIEQQLMNPETGRDLLVGIDRRLRSLREIPARKVFGKALKIIPGLTQRLGKNVAFHLEGADEPVDCEIGKELNTALVHLIRNVFDHGIEDPEERLENGKSEQGKVKMSVECNGELKISLTDDGRGIDPRVIRRKAVEKGFVDHSQIEKMGNEEIISLIMLPGFSTAQQVSEVSGRGVGMDAVYSCVKNLHGDLKIASEVGKGTTFTIRVPLDREVSTVRVGPP